MDTGTHITMGVALGGLATLDTAVSSDPTLFSAVMVGTIVGSHAPDFDTVLKLKNNAVYLRHHRGITHSIPAILLWGLVISGIIHAFAPDVNYFHLWLWTFIAVTLHVLVDIFNAYGTQAYRPFTKRWVAYGFINTFDPYIFALHVIGIAAWLFGADPGYTWLTIYFIIAVYYFKRFLDKRELVNKIHQQFNHVEEIITSPTMKNNYWRIVITTNRNYYVGVYDNGELNILDTFEQIALPNNKLIDKAKEDENIAAFLSFSPVYRWEMNLHDDFTELRLIDLRYRTKGYYPFVAVVQIDDNMRIISSYTGWIFSEKKLKRKLIIDDPASLS